MPARTIIAAIAFFISLPPYATYRGKAIAKAETLKIGWNLLWRRAAVVDLRRPLVVLSR